MELGQVVRFNKYLTKRPYVNRYGSEFSKENNYRKWDTEVLEETKEGIVCGKRTINYRGYTTRGSGGLFLGDVEPPQFKSLEKKEVYLVAVTLRGFYRVPVEWLKIKGE